MKENQGKVGPSVAQLTQMNSVGGVLSNKTNNAVNSGIISGGANLLSGNLKQNPPVPSTKSSSASQKKPAMNELSKMQSTKEIPTENLEPTPVGVNNVIPNTQMAA